MSTDNDRYFADIQRFAEDVFNDDAVDDVQTLTAALVLVTLQLAVGVDELTRKVEASRNSTQHLTDTIMRAFMASGRMSEAREIGKAQQEREQRTTWT